ncbi:MAG: hypothetical protein ACRD1V_01650 [Vicinamibacterales bacterium]
MGLVVCVAAPAGAQTATASRPYVAVTNRNTYAKPPLPALGPAGSTFSDPVFHSSITRVTDSVTRPGFHNYSFRTTSSPHQNEWSANGSYFYVLSTDGTAIPFRFNAATGTASRINPTSTSNGGMVLSTYIEPQFSYVNDSIIYLGYSGVGTNDRTIDQYDFSTGVYTTLVNLDTVVSGLSGTYIGGVASSAGSTERVEVFFGGVSQDHHHYVLVFDHANPSSRLLLDTSASTLNGQPTPITLDFSLHAVNIDHSGRYVMLYPTAADQASARQAPQAVLWDTLTGSFVPMVDSMLPYGHDAFGYGVMVNQDCCTSTTWDAAQWQFRSLAAPAVTRDMLPTVVSPKEVYLSDHTTWNNASATTLVPYISATFRYGDNTAPWRALDDEIIAVETDVPGQNPTIWRFAHHRSDVTYDGNPSAEAFWYEPRPNVSDDGRWVLFTSNWEKTLGTDPKGDPGTGARQDVFLVNLTTSGTFSAGTTMAGGCATADPFMSIGGGTCVNGGWIPSGDVSAPVTPPAPSTSSASTSGCTAPDPFVSIGGGVCVNGGWIPGGMMSTPSVASASTTTTAPTSSSTSTSSSSSAGCTIPDPFTSIGGGTCVNGGWIPGHIAVSTGTSSGGTSTTTTHTAAQGGCTIPDPFVWIGGGTCINGGWIPKR